MNCEHVHLLRSRFNSDDVMEFLRRWMDGNGKDRISYVYFEHPLGFGPLDFEELNATPWDPVIEETMMQPESSIHCNLSRAMNIRQTGGRVGTISQNSEIEFAFFVWEEKPADEPGVIPDELPEPEDVGVIPKETETTAITTASLLTSFQTGTTKKLPKLGTVGWGAIAGVPTTTAITTTPNTFMSSISPKPTYTKMIMFHGKVFSPTTTRVEISTEDGLSAKECIQECYASETCILAYMDTSRRCRFYDYTERTTITIEETTDKDGEVVGFKVDLEDFDCPLTYKDHIGSIVTRTGNTGYVSLKIIKWEKTDNGWTMKM
ncbi:hypothetical protein B9Z55_006971 [Caenorhabditis nigoni]|nr:hypothetical protein B9Z55_006971 [Caenorhabditis nigoni]